MIPRKQLDILWADLAFAAWASLAAAARDDLQRQIEEGWSRGAASLACLSVRSGFDAVLTALDFPPGSEVLVSAVTIRDMVRILEAHALVPIPVDLDMRRLAVRDDLLARAVTPRTKGVLVAHLFGSRMPLGPVLDVARRHDLLVMEDCAQAYACDAFRGHEGSDVALFSFGPIKTATALGGGLLRFRDERLRNRVRGVQSRWPVQSRSAFLARTLKYAALKLLTSRAAYTLFCRACRLLGVDRDQIVSRSVRGFAGGDLLAKIRRQPSAALLALLGRRLSRSSRAAVDQRMASARHAAAQLPLVQRPGDQAHDHSHWVFPILHAAPEELIAHLDACGFDATCGTSSLCVVDPPPDRPETLPAEAQAAFRRSLYLPMGGEMSREEIDRLARSVQEFRAPRPATSPPAIVRDVGNAVPS